MKFIKTAIASITLSAISGSVFATTYFSLQEKSDAIQQVRTEANAAARLNRFIILKYNNDRANFNQQDWDFYHKTEETLENTNARIAEIMRAPVVAMPSRPNPPTPTVTPLMQPHMVPNKVPTPVANNVLSNVVIPAVTLTAAQKTPTPLTPAIPRSVFGAAYIDAKNNQSIFTPPPRTVIPAATLTAAQKTPTPLTPAIPPSVFGAAYIDAKNNQSVFTPPPRTIIPAATLTVAQKTPTPVVQPGVAMANLTPQKLNGSQHPTNEHHISDAPVKQPYNVPVQTATHFVSLTPSVKPQGVPTPKYNNIALVGSHLDSNVTDAQRLRSILENAPKAANGVDGKKGAKGAKGDTGATGAQGVTGIKGRDGINGHNGKDGVTTTVTRMQVDTVTQTKVANNSHAITTTAQDLQATKQTLQAMNNNTSQQFKSLRDEVDNNKKQANAGISGAMAMAGLPQVQTDQRVMFSAGGATYNGESALAVGASVNFNSHVIGKVSFSDDTANNMGASVGIGMGF
ncbi:YadA C-terminal domain-containing protein [Enterobacter cloacae]|uniref:YadA C-terminal domain-containing protein n=1 Tax=Enterobacter cloacae TaxID=550 RepID=UPI001E31BE8F|nr:YadA C-terminal domain-containing protein [Enterobacter cloacae]